MAKVFKSLITSIDIGTTKISVLIAQKLGHEQLEILGIGKSPSHGLERGVVVDIARTVASINQAVKEAELMAGCEVESAFIGISGSHIQSFNAHGAVPIKQEHVQEADIKAVLEAAKAVPIEEGQKILHVLPQYYIVDGKDKVTNPLGLHGIRLEATVHVITGAVTSMQNLIKCCELAGVMVKDVVLEQLASADGVLSYDERELGVGVLDIGGGTSDFAVYQQGSIRYTKVMPIAGNLFTKDLAVGLRATLQDAERVKREHGTVDILFQEQGETIDVEVVNGNDIRQVAKQEAAYILHARAYELLLLLQQEIVKAGLKPFMISGLVITGGGSLLKGIDELAQNILSLPVRIGHIKSKSELPDSLNHPMYATGYGLLEYALQKSARLDLQRMQGPMVKRVFAKMKSWVDNLF